MEQRKISFTYFKQTIILFSVSFGLFIMTSIYHLGIIGVIVFIRAIFMLRTEYRGYKNYIVEENKLFFKIQRDEELFFVYKKDILSQETTIGLFSCKLVLSCVDEFKNESKYVLAHLKS